MRKRFRQINWEFVYDMVRDFLETAGQIDETFRQQVLHETVSKAAVEVIIQIYSPD